MIFKMKKKTFLSYGVFSSFFTWGGTMKKRMKRQKICILPRLNDCNGDTNKQWFVYYSYLNPKTNKMVRFRTSEGFSSLKSAAARRKVANKLLEKLTNKLKNGWNPFEDDTEVIYSDNLQYDLLAKETGRLRKSNKTFEYYMSEFLQEKKPNIRISTYHTYNSKFRVMKEFLTKQKINGNDITEFGDADARRFIDYLFEVRKIHNKMANQYVLLFKAFFKHLIKRRILNVNPFEGIQHSKEASVPAKYFQLPTLEIVKKTILGNDPQLWTIAQFEFYCMIRPSELRKLQIKNINMFEATVTVPAYIAKNGEQRTVVIPEPFHKYLLEIMQPGMYPEDYFIISKKKHPDQEPVGKNYMWNHFDKIRKLINLPRDYKLYSFKHTGNVMAAKSGIGLKEIQMQNGHHSLLQEKEVVKKNVKMSYNCCLWL